MPDEQPRHDDATHRLLDRPLSTEDLDERTRRVAHALDTTDERSACVMVFILGGEHFALHAHEVACVRPPAVVHPIPHRTSDVLRGLCNIDGELVLNMNLRAVLSLRGKSSDTGQGRFVVIGDDHERWSFAVDEVVGMFNYAADQEQPLPLTVGEDHRHFSTTVVHLPECQAARLDLTRVTRAFEAALK